MFCYSTATLSEQCSHLFLCKPHRLIFHSYIYLYSAVFTSVKYDFSFSCVHIYLPFQFFYYFVYIGSQSVDMFNRLSYFRIESNNIYYLPLIFRFHV